MSSFKRPSGISLSSRTTYGVEEEPNYKEMTNEELKECLELSMRMNKILTLENDIFENYLSRHDPQSLVAMTQVLETAKLVTSQIQTSSPRIHLSDNIFGFNKIRGTSMSSSSVTSFQTSTGSRGFASSLTAQSSTKGFRITLSHRIDMANKEIDQMKKQLSIFEKETSRQKENLRAQIEEIQLRIKDINIAREEFEEKVSNGVEPRTTQIRAEKFVKFMETWMKAADRMMDKLRLNSSTMKSQIKRAKIQLKQREELGETLHLIDFQALAIENQDLSRKIGQKTKLLIDLKKISGAHNHELSKYQDQLNNQQMVLNNMSEEINLKSKQIEKLRSDLANSEHQLAKMNRILKAIDDYEMPDVVDLIKMPTKLQDIKNTNKRLERQKM